MKLPSVNAFKLCFVFQLSLMFFFQSKEISIFIRFCSDEKTEKQAHGNCKLKINKKPKKKNQCQWLKYHTLFRVLY